MSIVTEKRVLTCIIAIVLVVLLLLGIVIRVSVNEFFEASGVNILGQYAHINVQTKCYFLYGVDKSSDANIESTITISGLVRPQKQSGDAAAFTGHANVAGYPIDFDQASRWTSASVGSEFIHISNQALTLLDGECERWYAIDILISDPSVIVVEIFNENGSVIAVTGETEEEAIENYQRYSDIVTE